MHYITDDFYSVEKINALVVSIEKIGISEASKIKVSACADYLKRKLTTGNEVIYGINTGFGSMCNTVINNKELEELQVNLVRSHACGAGAKIPIIISKRILLLKAIALCKGYSGVYLETIERILWLYNNDVIPVIYELGSLGASGDLAPLAHMSLPLIGEGEVHYKGEIRAANEVLKEFGVNPIHLHAKEGLALLNGTQFMAAFLSYCVHEGIRIFDAANTVGSLTIDAFLGLKSPFQANVNALRNQKGQIEVARIISDRLEGSALMNEPKKHVQDPYSLRCIPQVHGASKDTLDFCREIIENEINAVTDNPTIFPESDEIISAGNFHGQPLALALDYLAIAIAELGSISERRTYKLISGERGLPPFLVKNPGLHSGLMIAQYSCASMVSQNKQLCTPASVDTIDSSNGQEDHVSMGANAATKCKRVIENVQNIIGIELLSAAQAIDFRRPLQSSKVNEELLTAFREEVSFIESDRVLSNDIHKSNSFLFK
jgi:histidine ammonia-lyase